MAITKKRFFEHCQDVGLLAAKSQLDVLWAKIQEDMNDGKEANPGQRAVAAYVDAYLATYQSKTKPMPQECRQLKQLAEAEGIERACALIETYFLMPGFEGHPVSQLFYHLNKVRIRLDTGRQITRQEVQRDERRQANANAFGRLIAKGKADE
jgi:hypothetical protein